MPGTTDAEDLFSPAARAVFKATSSTAPRLRAMASEWVSRAAECGSDDLGVPRRLRFSSPNSFAAPVARILELDLGIVDIDRSFLACWSMRSCAPMRDALLIGAVKFAAIVEPSGCRF